MKTIKMTNSVQPRPTCVQPQNQGWTGQKPLQHTILKKRPQLCGGESVQPVQLSNLFSIKDIFYLIDYLKHFTYLKEMVGQVGQMAEVGQIQGNDHNNTELRMPIL